MSKRQGLPVDLTEEQIDEFGREMDAIYYETLESRGEKDRLYILRLIRIQRSMRCSAGSPSTPACSCCPPGRTRWPAGAPR